MTAFPVKTGRRVYRATVGSRVKRVNQGLLAKGALQERGEDQAPPVAAAITPRTRSQ